jgi:hypothetical protein
MEIGILSMQRVVNYGSFLQAYALKQTISALGHTVEFVDIENCEHLYANLWPRQQRFVLNCCKAEIHRILGQKSIYHQMSAELKENHFYYRLYRLYPFLWKRYLGLSEKSNTRLDYDALVIGSDEVFNCAQKSEWGQTMKLFGEGFSGKCLASYAASFAQTSLTDLEQLSVREQVALNLSRFSALSVRDEHSKQLIKELIGIEPSVHLDPVFIYDYPEASVTRKQLNTLIVYAYPNRICEPALIQEICSFAHKHSLRIVSIGAYYNWAENPVLTPFEVLKAFQEAAYIVTDTFHGTVFSLKYQKQFATIIRDANSNKLSDLLMRFEASSRAIDSFDQLGTVLETLYNKDNVKRRIDEGRYRAICFLREALR